MKGKIVCICLLAFNVCTYGQTRISIKEEFEPLCDSLSVLLQTRTSVEGKIALKNVMRRSGGLDFYFTESLGDFPWHPGDEQWLRRTLKTILPQKYSSCKIGAIYSKGVRLSDLITPLAGNDGKPVATRYRIKDPKGEVIPLISKENAQQYDLGMSGRTIAMWQSHGRYYSQTSGRWEWQRSCMFQTVEDMFTQSFVLPFLVPMLENAGAYVMLPRERDYNIHEVIVDNDPAFERDGAAEQTTVGNPFSAICRGTGTYSESGKWSSAGEGFADAKEVYSGDDNPFTMGSARQAKCIVGGGGNPSGKAEDGNAQAAKASSDKSPAGKAEAVWRPDIPQRGEYAVYVSWKSLPNSTESAHYKVRHLGGETSFFVNQKIGGGTWIYLGTFEFEKGTQGCVSLDNVVSQGRKFTPGSVVTADAVKIGGGVGNIARKVHDSELSQPETSGLPRFAEAARYWLQWAGADSTVISWNEQKNDYRDDLFSRGEWVDVMSGGSSINPRKKGKGIPIDIAFALHSDAGVRQCDSTVGTLVIYSRLSDGKGKFPSGTNRMTCREYADFVQTQVVSDLRHSFDSIWNRRQIWDRNYRESRTPPVPTILLEMFSHQNFSDMRFGHDPSFRFTLSRAVYKGMLKYLSSRYGCNYAVQPLPINSFAVVFKDAGTARLMWKDTPDPLEKTAMPKGYILYTRIDEGAFDGGRIIDPGTFTISKSADVPAEAKSADVPAEAKSSSCSRFIDIPIEPGRIYSFKIEAFNDGGKSFPSEILSIGIPESRAAKDSCILIVNNFDRVSAPTWLDSPKYAGFRNRADSGVPYIKETAFTGEMYQYRRDMPWHDNDNPGFGASYSDCAGLMIAGNTFDYPAVHGKSVMKAGYPFCSASSIAFASDTVSFDGIWCADIICGKQVTVPVGDNLRYTVFTPQMRSAIKRHAENGCDILISGAYIGTDAEDEAYPIERDSSERAAMSGFIKDVLGYVWRTDCAGRKGEVRVVIPPSCKDKVSIDIFCKKPIRFSFPNVMNASTYCVESPDGIVPASSKSHTFLRYTDTNISAGIFCDKGGYRTVCIGFPIEIVPDDAKDRLIEASLKYFRK